MRGSSSWVIFRPRSSRKLQLRWQARMKQSCSNEFVEDGDDFVDPAAGSQASTVIYNLVAGAYRDRWRSPRVEA